MPGTKAKQADALRLNVRQLVQVFGVERVGFLTLTVGDWMQGPMLPGEKRPFVPLCDRKEAERRFHRAMQHIRKRYQCGVTVTERTDNNGIHWHLVVVVGADIRSGIDFAAIEKKDYRSAPVRLRLEWKWWRENGVRWRLGRHELLPCKVNGDAIGTYVGKYIGKGWDNRQPEDKGGRNVRYFGNWDKYGRVFYVKVDGKLQKVIPGPTYGVRVCRTTARAGAWRECMRQIALRARLEGFVFDLATVRNWHGPKWAWRLTQRLRTTQFFVPNRLHPLFRTGLDAHNEEVGQGHHIGDAPIEHWLPLSCEVSPGWDEHCRPGWKEGRERTAHKRLMERLEPMPHFEDYPNGKVG